MNFLSKLIASGLGAGFSPIAPGTAGSALAVAIAWSLRAGWNAPLALTLTAVLIRRPPAGDWNVQALLVLVYLGLVPTALGFYLWNKGAARTGSTSLGVANNLKIPLAVLVSWLVFGEDAAYVRALGGMVLIMAGLVAARPRGSVSAAAAVAAVEPASTPAFDLPQQDLHE